MQTPTLIIPKMGVLKVGNKTFGYNDITQGLFGIEQYGLDSSWYGGRVQNFGKTKEGFLLCVEGTNVIGVYISSLDDITDDGKNLLRMEGLLEIDETFPIETTPQDIQTAIETPLTQEEVTEAVSEINTGETLEQAKEDVTAKLNELVNKRISNRKKVDTDATQEG